MRDPSGDRIYVNREAKLRYFKARHLPYALKEDVDKELQRFQNKGIIDSVCFSEWATPIVPIVKKDKKIRICGEWITNSLLTFETGQLPDTQNGRPPG